MRFHIFHSWGKWEHYGNLRRRNTNSVVGRVMRRKCSICGKEETVSEFFI